jgi:hypothetical protein
MMSHIIAGDSDMRKLVLLAGTALTATAAPALACDLELMGGPQRFSAFAAYGASHASIAVAVESQDNQQEAQSDAEPERQTDAAEASAAPTRNDEGAPSPSATFR